MWFIIHLNVKAAVKSNAFCKIIVALLISIITNLTWGDILYSNSLDNTKFSFKLNKITMKIYGFSIWISLIKIVIMIGQIVNFVLNR